MPFVDDPLATEPRGLSALATATVAMFAGAAVLLLVGFLMWEPGRNPRWVLLTLLVAAVLVAATVLAWRQRLTRAQALPLMAIQVAAVVSMTFTTDLELAALANGSVLPVVGAYTTWFLHPLWGRALFYSGVVAWLGAVSTHDTGTLLGFSLSVAAQCVLAAEAFALIRRRVERFARADPLTGVLNRRGAAEVARQVLERAARRGHPVSVAVLDIDDLRTVNNEQGHAAGDALLAAVTADWCRRLRPQDVVARTGGDEFVLVLSGTTEAEAEAVLERLAHGSPCAWTAGVAAAAPGDDLASLMARADARMYARKGRTEREVRRAGPR